jgi:hypothetical protein
MGAAEDMFRDTVNDAIARLLPYAPRDFTVEVNLVNGKARGQYSANVRVVALTDMGRAIKPVLQRRLSMQIAKLVQEQGGSYGAHPKTQTEPD